MKQKRQPKLIGKTPSEIRKELREMVYETRKKKLAQRAAAVPKKVISFSWEAAKAFVSDLQFKKEKVTPKKDAVVNETKVVPSQNKESKSISYYDRWYNAVSAEKTII